MPVKSYLARPHKDRFQELLIELAKLDGCEIIPSTNKEVVVLVTDTKDEITDNELLSEINEVKSLKMLSMVSGFNDNT